MAKLLYALTHIPQVVLPLFNSLGSWTYVILFSLIFMETGLVVFPWLPGQSLIFVTSSFAALHGAEVKMSILVPGFFIAAVLGDTLNYLIGTRLIKWPWLKRRLAGPTMAKAQLFFSRYGLRAIIFGRFVPLIRTFVPLISGIAKYRFGRFMLGNVLGVAIWVVSGALAGYYLGSIPFVQDHFSSESAGVLLNATSNAISYNLPWNNGKLNTKQRTE